MSRIYIYLAIAGFGILGCLARYLMTQLVQGIWGTSFPYATLIINVSGSFLMGFLFVETLERLTLTVALRTGILTGFIGGYTTFSTYMMETILLAEQGLIVRGALYIVLSTLIGLVAAYFGVFLARSI
jgi:fluoride exporter